MYYAIVSFSLKLIWENMEQVHTYKWPQKFDFFYNRVQTGVKAAVDQVVNTGICATLNWFPSVQTFLCCDFCLLLDFFGNIFNFLHEGPWWKCSISKHRHWGIPFHTDLSAPTWHSWILPGTLSQFTESISIQKRKFMLCLLQANLMNYRLQRF